jgi:hypothetical protein
MLLNQHLSTASNYNQTTEVTETTEVKVTTVENLITETFKNVWIYTTGNWSSLMYGLQSPFFILLHFGTCGILRIDYYRDEDSTTIVRSLLAQVIYNYTGRHTVHVKLYCGYFKPGFLKGGCCTAIGFCRELKIT